MKTTIKFIVCLTFVLTSLFLVYNRVQAWELLDKDLSGDLIESIEQLNSPEYTIAVMQDSSNVSVVQKVLPKVKMRLYNGGAAAGAIQVLNKQADAFVYDSPTLDYLSANNPKLVVFPEPLGGDENLVVASARNKSELIKEVNQFIVSYRADGTYQDMYNRWFTRRNSVIPNVPKPLRPTRKIIVGIEGNQVPFNFYGTKGVPLNGGYLTGFDVEFTLRLAYYLNAEVEWRIYKWTDLLATTQNGTIDLMVSGLTATQQRRTVMALSMPYIDSKNALLVHRDRIHPALLEEVNKKRATGN